MLPSIYYYFDIFRSNSTQENHRKDSFMLKAQCHLLQVCCIYGKGVVFYDIWLNTAYYITKVSVINTEFSVYINLLQIFLSGNMINN